MDDLNLFRRDVAPLLTGVLGLVVGAILSELRVLLAGARERRRTLNVIQL